MAREEQIVTEGIVTQVLPKRFIQIVPGDKVSVDLSPYDLTKARIIFRGQ